QQYLARLPADGRADATAESAARVAWASGDFATYERYLRDEERAIAGESDEGAHSNVALALVELYMEAGRPEDARSAAEDFFRKRSGWDPIRGSSDGDLYNDRRGELIAALLHTGALTPADARARRDAWVHELEGEVGGVYRATIWAH